MLKFIIVAFVILMSFGIILRQCGRALDTGTTLQERAKKSTSSVSSPTPVVVVEEIDQPDKVRPAQTHTPVVAKPAIKNLPPGVDALVESRPKTAEEQKRVVKVAEVKRVVKPSPSPKEVVKQRYPLPNGAWKLDTKTFVFHLVEDERRIMIPPPELLVYLGGVGWIRPFDYLTDGLKARSVRESGPPRENWYLPRK